MAFDGEFKLTTEHMDDAASCGEKLAQEMRGLKQELDDEKTKLMETWDGDASITFEKKYHSLIQQLSDLTDVIFEMAENIYTAEDTYIQTDMNSAKVLSGVESPL